MAPLSRIPDGLVILAAWCFVKTLIDLTSAVGQLAMFWGVQRGFSEELGVGSVWWLPLFALLTPAAYCVSGFVLLSVARRLRGPGTSVAA